MHIYERITKMVAKSTSRKQDLLSRRDELKLNDNLKIILMKPGEQMLFRYGAKLDDVNKILPNVKFSTQSILAGKDVTILVPNTLGIAVGSKVTIIDNPPDMRTEEDKKANPITEPPTSEEAEVIEVAPTFIKVKEVLKDYIMPRILYDWVRDEVSYNKVMKIVKAFLIQCVRDSEDHHKHLIVDDGEIPGPGQEIFEDFNPEIVPKIVAEQDGFEEKELNLIEETPLTTPQLYLFNRLMQKSGWYTYSVKKEEVESFPDDGQGNQETDNNGTV